MILQIVCLIVVVIHLTHSFHLNTNETGVKNNLTMRDLSHTEHNMYIDANRDSLTLALSPSSLIGKKVNKKYKQSAQ